jgi:hypothetical protein
MTTEVEQLDQQQVISEEYPSITLSDEWCIERKSNPSMGLCGAWLMEPSIPDQEVPEERLCPQCRDIRDSVRRLSA